MCIRRRCSGGVRRARVLAMCRFLERESTSVRRREIDQARDALFSAAAFGNGTSAVVMRVVEGVGLELEYLSCCPCRERGEALAHRVVCRYPTSRTPARGFYEYPGPLSRSQTGSVHYVQMHGTNSFSLRWFSKQPVNAMRRVPRRVFEEMEFTGPICRPSMLQTMLRRKRTGDKQPIGAQLGEGSNRTIAERSNSTETNRKASIGRCGRRR